MTTTSRPLARITGNPLRGYRVQLWTAHGSCIVDALFDAAQQAHDEIEAIMPGVQTHWHVEEVNG